MFFTTYNLINSYPHTVKDTVTLKPGKVLLRVSFIYIKNCVLQVPKG